MIRTALSLLAIFVLLHFADRSDVLSDLTRPVVVASLKCVGVNAADHGASLAVGRLAVPWSRDCAGLNVLAILWALALWTGRNEPLSPRYWLRLALAVPVSLLANVARILTLIAYRHAFFPSAESPELHYFIGFLWVMPCLGLFVARAGRPFGIYFLEALYVAAVLALLAPLVHAPGGNAVVIATLVVLSQARVRTLESVADWTCLVGSPGTELEFAL